MATGREKLERHFDRLEKLFSKKKRATAAQHSYVLPNSSITTIPFSTASDSFIQTFPEPTFIRPTSSRMVAREEVAWTPRSMRRARSLPESPSTPRLTAPPTPTYSGQTAAIPKLPGQCPGIPLRFSSLGPDTPPPLSPVSPGLDKVDPLPELHEFSFSTAPIKSEDNSSPSRRSRSASKSSSHRTSGSVSPKAQRNRKRLSADAQDEPAQQQPAQQDKHSNAMQCERESELFELAPKELSVPPLSPRLVPLPEPSPDELDNDGTTIPQSTKDLRSSRAALKPPKTSPRKPTSPSTVRTAQRRSDSDSSLQEPTLSDFLTLSDDDIADSHVSSRPRPTVSIPPTFGLPPNPPVTVTPPRAASSYPLLTLCPPLASRPATAAAFEAARIATKYQFDLVYVVNLWPSHMSRSNRSPTPAQSCGTPTATPPTRLTIPSPPSSPVSDASGHDSGFEGQSPSPREYQRSSITGRLLAAYGLTSVMSPFRISAPVHQKVLRAQGWLEYRSPTGTIDEFARGYSCSFYTGYSPARGCETADSTTFPDGKQQRRKAKAPNRGVVFAAFRLPREDGTVICNSAEELEALYKDAESLVDMVIDIHMNQRKKRTDAPRRCENRQLAQAKVPLVTP